jgi:hypothetical protein
VARHLEDPAAKGMGWWTRFLLVVYAAMMVSALILMAQNLGEKLGTPAAPRTAVANTPAPALELPRATPTPTAIPSPKPTATSQPVYKTCEEADKADALPLREGDPGFNKKLDTDRDGKACENFG